MVVGTPFTSCINHNANSTATCKCLEHINARVDGKSYHITIREHDSGLVYLNNVILHFVNSLCHVFQCNVQCM